jgi:hypothetical protein
MDSRSQAITWVVENAEPGAIVVIEPSPWENPAFVSFTTIGPAPELTRTDIRKRVLEVGKIRHPYSETYRREYIEETLEGADYIMMSERNPYVAMKDSGADTMLKDYYQDLFSGELGFELVKEIKVYPALFGVEVRDDPVEMNMWIFDHPRVWIFKRKAAG